MINLLCIPPLFKIVYLIGCHGNGAISHSSNRFFLGDKLFLHLLGPSEQFGTHEKLSWECNVGLISRLPKNSYQNQHSGKLNIKVF